MILWLQAFLAAAISAIAAYTDHKTGKIPNRVCAFGAAAGLVLGIIGAGTDGLLAAVAGASAAGIVPLILFRMNAMGGGDVKLFFALGSLLGIGAALEVEMCSFFIGTIWGIALWIRRGRLLLGLKGMLVFAVPVVKKRFFAEGNTTIAKTEIKFAPSIFAAVLVVAIQSVARSL